VHPGLDYAQLNADFAEMEQTLRRQFATDGIDHTRVTFERFADARYVGQGYELRIAIADEPVNDESVQHMADAFHRQHEAEYGHCFVSNPIELVNLRITGVGPTQKIQSVVPPTGGSLREARVKTDQCVFRIEDGLKTFPTVFYRREQLPLGQTMNGPALILQPDSTTVIPPGCQGQIDEHGNLIITIGGAV
jgi:N-methylhydantoinase A